MYNPHTCTLLPNLFHVFSNVWLCSPCTNHQPKSSQFALYNGKLTDIESQTGSGSTWTVDSHPDCQLMNESFSCAPGNFYDKKSQNYRCDKQRTAVPLHLNGFFYAWPSSRDSCTCKRIDHTWNPFISLRYALIQISETHLNSLFIFFVQWSHKNCIDQWELVRVVRFWLSQLIGSLSTVTLHEYFTIRNSAVPKNHRLHTFLFYIFKSKWHFLLYPIFLSCSISTFLKREDNLKPFQDI